MLTYLINRIDYFQDLGIDAIWITPFYESPKIDNGYDISNHKAVDPEFGSMDDFEELIFKTSQCNIKVVIDIIFNHRMNYLKLDLQLVNLG